MQCMTRVGYNFVPQLLILCIYNIKNMQLLNGVSILKCSFKQFVNLTQIFIIGCASPNFYSKKKMKVFVFFLDDDEVLTYEEVGLLQPSRNRKRPVVLIGKMFNYTVVFYVKPVHTPEFSCDFLLLMDGKD